MSSHEIDEAIRELYPGGGPEAVQERFPEVTNQYLRYRASRLGIRCRAHRSTESGLDEAIHRLYPTGGVKAVQQAFPARSSAVIRTRASKLGVRRAGYRPPSTPEEDALLRRRYPTEGAAPVAEALGWSVEAVHAKATFLGVRSRSSHANRKLDAETVALIKARMRDESVSNRTLAADYGVEPSTISSIRTGRAWAKVAPAEQ